jgi:hypothetical protein
MKKLLLTAAFALGAFFTTKAQVVTSFETSEGFTAGNINGQNGWVSTSYTLEEGGETLYVENQTVSNAQASDGTYSLFITEEADFGPQESPVIGAFSPDYSVSGSSWSVEADIYIVPDGPVANGSDYTFNLYSNATTNGGFAARVNFSFSTVVRVVDLNEAGTGLTYVNTEFEWAPETWYHLTIAVDNEANTITYSIDDEVIYTGEPLNADFATIACTLDNYPGSAYFDGITVTGATMSTPDAVANAFSVSPNPASSIVTIANAENILVNAVTVADINGRVVKNLSFDSVTEAQVNISDLSNGVYMMTISSEKGSVTKKIIKN